MTALARWCFEHRKKVLGFWLLALILAVSASQMLGSNFNSNFNLPNTDSQSAVTLLAKNFPAATGEGDQIVIQSTHGADIRAASVQTAVTTALTKVAAVPGIASVTSPYSAAGAAQISRNKTVAFATVTWNRPGAKVTDAEAKKLITAAESADSSSVHVSLSGQSISSEESSGPGLSILVGVVAALLILLIVFGGALFASLMPLLTAILALIIATSAIALMTHAFDVASVSSDLAVLIGLGVGVDYGLFIISRHRSAVKAGLSYADAAVQAVNTSGRTVLFAGLTVCIALLGQFALGVSFLYGLSVSSAIAVALTMATSLTFLPAMLGFLGPKVLSRRERTALAVGGPPTGDASRFWLRWSNLMRARKALVAVGALGVVVVIALPIFGLRLGSSDASTDPTSSTTHQAYTALSSGFGPGLTGPLELAGQVSTPPDRAAFNALLTATAHTPGVAAVTPAIPSPNGRVELATVYPTTSPQDQRTVTLVKNLRNNVIPLAESDTSLRVHVGGVTATDIDFSKVLGQKLPLFIAVVVLLAFILLTAVFRSLLIPLVASVMNLLSVGAALGALNAVFNWGWGASLIGLSGTGPIDAFIPVLLFSVLFGLSMDYEVYLVSRIQEEWQRLRRHSAASETHAGASASEHNHHAIVHGQAKSGRIILAAAVIMVLVFGSFLLTGSRLLQEFGFGLGFAVLIDALVIRSLLVPALMHIIGARNWDLPRWLDRVLPDLSIEAPEDSTDTPMRPESIPVG
ncbi:MAG: MMPL family transporter [Actinomycetota bacterium]|nr:MMPL family transporter [Actinomycetota bacterium]